MLPLANLSPDGSDSYFAEAMHENLVSRLGMIPSITVTSRNSVLRYRGGATPTRSIAKDLGVDFVLEGSARRDSGRVYVSVRLIDARTDAHLWTHSYAEGPSVASLFDIQADIARRLADALQVSIGATVRGRIGGRPTESTAACDVFFGPLSSRLDPTHRQTAPPEELLKQALTLDPGFPAVLAALAQVYRARAYTLGGSRTWADSGLVLARLGQVG